MGANNRYKHIIVLAYRITAVDYTASSGTGSLRLSVIPLYHSNIYVSLSLGAITRYKHLIVRTSRIELGAYIISDYSGIINLCFWYLHINGMYIPTYVSPIWRLVVEKDIVLVNIA